MNYKNCKAGRLKSASSFLFGLIGMLAATLSGVGQTQDGLGPVRVQTIQLEAGWNAVYLEIEPRKGDPSALFAGTPIEIAATYNRPVTSMEFIDSPDQVLPDRKTWNVWYAPQREDAVLGNLSAIQAHKAYLIYTKQACTWSLEGTPFHDSAQWHPNAFSLVGFPIDAAKQPTVASFFAGAAAHTPLKAYRMSGGQWSLIAQPDQTLMKPGAAYWIYSEGDSDFRGPLVVDFPGSSAGGLVFNEASNTRQLQIRSNSPFPQSLTFTMQAGGTGLVPLSYVIRVLDAPGQPIDETAVPLSQGMQLGPLEAGTTFLLDLEVVQEAVTTPVMSSTLTIVSTAGSRIEVPVLSLRSDLLPSP